MSATIVPCPNGGKCGSLNHYTDSTVYSDCLSASIKSRLPGGSSQVPEVVSTPPLTVGSSGLETNELEIPFDDDPAIWVGSVEYYDQGHLVGRWFSAEDAGYIEPVDVFEGSGIDDFDSNNAELRVYQTRNMPKDAEMDISEAEEWNNVLENNDIDVIYAYIDATGYDDVFDFENLEDKYQGKFDDLEEYARHYVDGTGLLDGANDTIKSYFDFKSFGDDIRHDLLIGEVEGQSGIYVFESW